MRRTTTVGVLWIVLVISACGDAGETAFREGRIEDAHGAFVRATEDEDAPARLLANRALAALAVGKIPDAATAVERLDESGVSLDGVTDLLRGCVAHARCEVATAQAAAPESEPFAFEVARRYGQAALASFEAAAWSRPDWPEARRNVERALLALERLRRLEEERESKKRSDPTPRPKILPRPGPEATPEPDRPPEAVTRELAPEEVLALLEKLRAKEQEKRDLRREHRGARAGDGVEKDW